MMKLRIASPRYLIDVNRIEGLDGVRQRWRSPRRSGRCAVTPTSRRRRSSREHLPIMSDAASQTADVQVRNRGTVAGSLAHADPAGDWPAALMALDTEVTIAGPSGSRRVSLDDFIVDAYTTQLEPAEMMTGRLVGDCPGAGAAGAYAKFEKRAGRLRGRQRRRPDHAGRRPVRQRRGQPRRARRQADSRDRSRTAPAEHGSGRTTDCGTRRRWCAKRRSRSPIPAARSSTSAISPASCSAVRSRSARSRTRRREGDDSPVSGWSGVMARCV